jgi:hypothetical protein
MISTKHGCLPAHFHHKALSNDAATAFSNCGCNSMTAAALQARTMRLRNHCAISWCTVLHYTTASAVTGHTELQQNLCTAMHICTMAAAQIQ